MALTDLFVFIAIVAFLCFLLQLMLEKANKDLKKALPILKEDRFLLVCVLYFSISLYLGKWSFVGFCAGFQSFRRG